MCDLKKKRYAIIDYMGSWNIGAFIVATDRFVIIGDGFRPKIIEEIEKVLDAPVFIQKVYEEDLIGCLVVANSNGVLVPMEALDEEISMLRRKLDVPVEKISFGKTYNNALGNIILTNDRRAIIHESIYSRNRREVERIEAILDVEVIPFGLEFTDAIASYAVVNSRGLAVSPLFSQDEIEKLREFLGIPKDRVVISTINMGNPIVRSGCIANNRGILVGNRTTGVELARLYNALIGGEEPTSLVRSSMNPTLHR